MLEYTPRPRESAVESIIAYIAEHNLSYGDKLPSERNMCEMWGLNRSTLRSALSKLTGNGTIEARHGSGIYYLGKKYSRMFRGLSSFESEISQQEIVHHSKVLVMEKVESDLRLAGIFGIVPEEPLWHLVRMRYSNGISLQLERCYFRVAQFPGIEEHDFALESLYRVFTDRYGYIPTKGEEVISITIAGDDARYFEIDENAPLLRTESQTYDQHNHILEYTVTVARPDKVNLSSTMIQLNSEK